jgi:hypothetical protein
MMANNKFNFFKLDEPSDRNSWESWICVIGDFSEFDNIFKMGLERAKKEIIKNKINLYKKWLDKGKIPLFLAKIVLRNKESLKVKFFNQIIYFETGSYGLKTKLPKEPNKELSYLTGLIIGDGSLPDSRRKKKQYCVNFENCNLYLAKKYKRIFKKLFGVDIPIRYEKRKGRQIRYKIEISSKIIQRFFANVIGIPKGKKSFIVKVPDFLKNSKQEIVVAFIKGLFDSDGGKTGGLLGISSRSESLIDGLNKILISLNFKPIKNYEMVKNKPYFKLKIPKSESKKFINMINSINLEN